MEDERSRMPTVKTLHLVAVTHFFPSQRRSPRDISLRLAMRARCEHAYPDGPDPQPRGLYLQLGANPVPRKSKITSNLTIPASPDPWGDRSLSVVSTYIHVWCTSTGTVRSSSIFDTPRNTKGKDMLRKKNKRRKKYDDNCVLTSPNGRPRNGWCQSARAVRVKCRRLRTPSRAIPAGPAGAAWAESIIAHLPMIPSVMR
jgi:hypothetical protein